MSFIRRIAPLATCVAVLTPLFAATPAPVSSGADTLARLSAHAMQDGYAYERLTDLTDLIGPRLSGSAGAAAAVEQVAAQLRALGARVTLQPVKVPHWVRGEEKADIADYAGKPAGVFRPVALTALGGSGATPEAGITAPVMVVHSLEAFNARASEAKGKIVVFDVAFDQGMAEAGRAFNAYGESVRIRSAGPIAAAKAGAVAALVRSIGGADYRLVHTGATSLGRNGNPVIPAAALAAEDAMLLSRLSQRGEVKLHLTLTPKNLPDTDSFNVIADLPGSDKPEEIVIVSGHLDSWDLAQGAIDDGAGVAASMGVIKVIKDLGLTPRRTIRFVAWMNEENGLRGGTAYADAYRASAGKHVAAIETDGGVGRPLGLITDIARSDLPKLADLRPALRMMGAPVVEWRANACGSDLGPIGEAGVPCFEPMVDSRNYFDYHHTPADTLDKVNPDDLSKQVGLLAITAWYLANMDGRIVPREGDH
ncbi:M20/M25/M40 family metallo-hydrolase [Burkholderiaceae bacterium DAT-1]|nr:M20/M25/M40 family metallo-hydrolase [Burkholderiaceae bacterium DAT-1]